MNKLSQLIQDRNGKLSPYKLSFTVWSLGIFVMMMYLSYVNNTFQPIPEGYAYFLGVIGASQLGKSYLANKAESNANPPKT